MSSPYQPNIPTGFVNLDTDYINIQQNFQQANTSFAADHIAFTDGTVNNGKHKQVSFPIPLANSPGTNANEWKSYTRTVAGKTNEFWQAPNLGAAGVDIQMSVNMPTSPISPANLVSQMGNIVTGGGYTFIPGGMVLMFGVVTSPSQLNQVTFPNNGFPNNCFAVYASPVQANLSLELQIYVYSFSQTVAKFFLTNGSSTSSFNWWAIGN
jgi:hypothetical protein